LKQYKDAYRWFGLCDLSEQHPREQGLKHGIDADMTLIYGAFRATSKRTRIETIIEKLRHGDATIFQSNIQENKD